MNEHDLFLAIGNADDEYLMESEGQQLHRPKWKGAMAAAIITVLVLTACAAPVIYGAIRESQLLYESTSGGERQPVEPGDTALQLVSEVDHYSIVIDFELAGDLPETIETACLPTDIPDGWKGGQYCVSESGYEAVHGNWFVGPYGPLETIQQVMYIQTVLTGYDPQTKEVHKISAKTDGEISSQMRKIGDLDVLEVAVQESDREYFDPETGETVVTPGWSMRYLYWSDGVYLYHMMIPYESDMEEVEALIASIQPAEMPTMTLEEYGRKQTAIMDQIQKEYEAQKNGE